jgi:nucleoside-diphosphate-sugar epimerase
MKIFVAGATGAIGLPLVRALTTLGHSDRRIEPLFMTAPLLVSQSSLHP